LSTLNPQLRGIALVVFSASSFACVDGISKVLAETQPVAQIVWARYALALPALLLMTGPRRWPTLFHTGQVKFQILRGLTPLTISVTMVLAVHFLPLAEATMILFMAPFLVVALSGAMLGEPVRPASWAGVAIGFAAVLVVTRPGLGGFSGHVVFPLIAAVFYALMQLLTRRLGAAGELADTTLAWTLAVGTLAVTPVAFATWPETSLRAWLLLVTLGTVFGLAQFLMIRAYTLAAAGVLAPFSYAQIVAAVVFGAIVWWSGGDSVAPDRNVSRPGVFRRQWASAPPRSAM
jgi:drug/metabolite transporter (DMT)-like permease